MHFSGLPCFQLVPSQGVPCETRCRLSRLTCTSRGYSEAIKIPLSVFPQALVPVCFAPPRRRSSPPPTRRTPLPGVRTGTTQDRHLGGRGVCISLEFILVGLIRRHFAAVFSQLSRPTKIGTRGGLSIRVNQQKVLRGFQNTTSYPTYALQSS
jgi:hypothetical protein